MSATEHAERYPQQIGRYMLFAPFAKGGMGTVHLGRLLGAAGFARTVAIKRLRAEAGLKAEQDFASMMQDEARIASRIRHTNVVPPLDFIVHGDDLLLVMEYVEGETLARLAFSGGVPPPIAVSIVVGALRGLHAAHEAKSERGRPLDIVHRDVSPENILVGKDGIARVVDFGIAKAAVRLHVTRDGSVKGKIAYMAPEQIRRERVDHRVDVYATAVVLWEALVGERLFRRARTADTIDAVLAGKVDLPSTRAAGVPAEVEAVVMRGLERDVAQRWPSAAAMADALEQAIEPANAGEVAKWVAERALHALTERARLLADVEGMSAVHDLTDRAGEPDARDQGATPDARDQEATPDAREERAEGPRKAAPTSPQQGRARLPLLLLAVAAAGALALALFVGWRLRGAGPSAPDGGVTAVSPVVPSVTESSPAPAAVASSSAAQAEVSAAPPGPLPSSSPRATTGTTASRPPAPTKRTPATPAAKRCDPPFVVDSSGVKIPKRECLQ